ncbi:MAG: hypothetical protein Roseis2KO_51380 [Roseivirga sp.]
MAGDYLIMEDQGGGSEREPGKQYVRITLTSEQHCLIETYFGFEMPELASHPHPERFRVSGDYLIYKNDSLINKLAEAKTLAETDPENQEYEKMLESLKYQEENGYLNHVTPIVKRGHVMTYNHEPVLEIDLLKNEVTGYDGENLAETRSTKIRFHNGRLFLSHSDREHGWENIIVELSEEGLNGFDISFKHVLKNKAQYEKTANLNQTGKNTIIIDPSVSELDKMLDEEGFLEQEMTLRRIELVEEADSKPSWWMIAIGALLLVVLLRAMRRPQTQS